MMFSRAVSHLFSNIYLQWFHSSLQIHNEASLLVSISLSPPFVFLIWQLYDSGRQARLITRTHLEFHLNHDHSRHTQSRPNTRGHKNLVLKFITKTLTFFWRKTELPLRIYQTLLRKDNVMDSRRRNPPPYTSSMDSERANFANCLQLCLLLD
jgi:hypothetical protein